VREKEEEREEKKKRPSENFLLHLTILFCILNSNADVKKGEGRKKTVREGKGEGKRGGKDMTRCAFW